MSFKECLRQRVFDNLDNALTNDYFKPGEYLHGASPEEIALDMVGMADDIETEDPVDLLPYVREWMARRSSP